MLFSSIEYAILVPETRIFRARLEFPGLVPSLTVRYPNKRKLGWEIIKMTNFECIVEKNTPWIAWFWFLFEARCEKNSNQYYAIIHLHYN